MAQDLWRTPRRGAPCRWPLAVPACCRVDGAARSVGAGLSGGALLLQLPPHSRLVVATQPVEFRTGIAGRCAVCRHALGANPLEGAVSVFRNRTGTALTRLRDDGQGSWRCLQRVAPGRCPWGPQTADARVPLSARALSMVLWHGDPERAQMAHDGRRVASGGPREA